MYVVIAGAGLVGRGLAERLIESRHDVVIVDHDKGVCEWLASHLGALIIFGSATHAKNRAEIRRSSSASTASPSTTTF